MLYAQFYQKSAISDELVEACGDRSVVIIDGRLSNENIGKIAEECCQQRGYLAWAIFKGESFTRSNRISLLWYIHNDKTDNSAMSALYGM